MANPNKAARDPILQDSSGGGGTPKRADLLNGQPRTKSISGGGANFSSNSPDKSGWPAPNNPYGGGE